MNLLLIVFLVGLAAYLSLKIFIRKPIAQLAGPQAGNATFESVVPTYTSGEEEEIQGLEFVEHFDEEWERNKPVLIEEAHTVLLLEAEKLIAKVEEIAVSKTDVRDKLHQLLPGFLLLYKTQYYEPVNQFIFLTIQRECGIELTDKELASFWS